MTLEIHKPLAGQPGIESVTKQYMYQLAYRKFVSDHGIKTMRNCFLMPTEEDEIINKGYVELGMLHNLGLENIQVRLLPARMMYYYYMLNQKMNIEELDL